MRRLFDWAVSWYTTWQFKRENPVAYKALCDLVANAKAEDFTEVPGTGDTTIRVHKDALENLRKLADPE
jgi:hypothetical protein